MASQRRSENFGNGGDSKERVDSRAPIGGRMKLREYFDNGLTVDAYTLLLDDDQTDLHELYERRAEIDPMAVDAIRASNASRILVITEPWCGDSLAIFPVVARLFCEAGCSIRVVRRDEYTELIDQYLTNGGRSIPVVIVLDEAFKECFHWGPRPKPAQAIVMESKAAIATGEMDKAEVHKKIRGFYARDLGKSIVAELTELATT